MYRKSIIKKSACVVLFLVVFSIHAFPCTSFVLKSGDRLVFGTNFDNSIRWGLIFANQRGVKKTGWEPGTGGKNISWISKYGSVTVNSVGYQLPWAGMNEAGLVLSTMAVEETRTPNPDERPALVSPFWMQYVLDTCESLKDVIASEKHVRISHGVDHYLVCDGKGNTAVIEFFKGRMIVHKGKDLPVAALANEAYSQCLETMKGLDLSKVDSYEPSARLKVLERLSNAYDPKKNGPPGYYAFLMLNKVSHRSTVWSLVFDIPNRTLSFRTDKNRAVRSIDLKKVSFTGQTLSPMMDVHAEGSGDITKKFQPYDKDVNLTHLLRALKAYGKEVSEEEVKEMYQMFLDFRCEKTRPER